MIDHIKPLVQRFFNKRGFEIVRMSTGLRPEEAATIELAKPHTAASLGRNLGMLDAVRTSTKTASRAPSSNAVSGAAAA